MFFTGCRPSEAAELRWQNLNDDCSKIRFTGSTVRCGGKALVRDVTKTKKPRTFPHNAPVQAFLEELKARSLATATHDLVFPSRGCKELNYNDFGRHAWKTITTSLGLESKHGVATTPYGCRDTSITIQALKGHSSDVIAARCWQFSRDD